MVTLNVSNLPRLKTNIVKIFIDIVSNRLKKLILNGKPKCMTVVLCSKGYLGIIKEYSN